MSAPRRTIIRPAPSPAQADHPRQLVKLRVRLDSERSALARWQTRLKRAFNTCQKHQQRIARLERQIHRIEEDVHA